MGERRIIHYFQWLRAIAAVGIVVLHAVFTVHNTGAYQLSDAERLRDGLTCVVCGRWCVPVFFMMSGALMLDPDREMGWDKTLRHVWRLGFTLLTFGLAFCLIESFLDYGSFSIAMLWESVLNLLTQRSWDHLWFVYQLLGFYLVTPIIRPWLAQASWKEYRTVALVACFLLLGVNTLSALLETRAFYYGFEVPHCFAYYLIGLCIHRSLELNGKWWALGIGSLVATVVLWYCFDAWWTTDPNRIVVAPFAVLVFLIAKRYLDMPIEEHRVASVLADYSFGIYLIHPLFQHMVVAVPGFLDMPLFAAIAIVAFVSLVLSVPAIWLLRFIPGFKGKV